MKKPIPRTFTTEDLRKGESIYFVGVKTVKPMPIDTPKDYGDWGFYFPNKEEAEKWANEYKAYLEESKPWWIRLLDKLGLI